jgi:plastocyanin
MNKIIIALSIIVLIGAGCAKTPAPQNENAIDTSVPESSISITTTNPDGTTSEQNIAVGNKTSTAKNVEQDDKGVPMIDIELTSQNSVRTIDLKSGNFFFEPKVINAKPGEKLRIDFRGTVGTHTFVINEANVKQTVKDGSGFEFVAPTTPGSYTYYCDIGNHRAQGMEGTLIVK